MKLRKHGFALCAVTALALVGAGCGSDSDSESTTAATAAPADTAATETTAATADTTAATDAPTATDAPDTTEAAAGPATGEPIVFMHMAPADNTIINFPHLPIIVQARVDAINAAGGVGPDHRPLKMEYCNDKADPNEASACARKAGEIGAVAVVGSLTTQAPTILPILTEEKIPWLSSLGSSGAIEVTEPISYPVMGGTLAVNYGIAKALSNDGAKNIAIIGSDNASSAANIALTEAFLDTISIAHNTAMAAADAVEFSATAATALESTPDAIIVVALPTAAPKIVQAVRQAGFTGPMAMGSSLLPTAAIEALGADANNILIGYRLVPVNQTENPTIAEFIKEAQAAQADIALDEAGLNAWTGVNFLKGIIDGMGDTEVTGPAIIDYLDNFTGEIDLGEVIPPYGSLDTAPPDYPRAKTFVAIIGKVIDGKVVQQGDFVSPFG